MHAVVTCTVAYARTIGTIGYRVPGTGYQEPSASDEGQEVPASSVKRSALRFLSLDALVVATGIRRDELNTLASLGALNAFGTDRRGALWNAERVVRPTGDLFSMLDAEAPPLEDRMAQDGGKDEERRTEESRTQDAGSSTSALMPKAEGPMTKAELAGDGPLTPMTPMERIVADYRGSGVTIGAHPMALRRADLRLRGVMRSDELGRTRGGRRVRVAGAVITRQRPGTAKGMVFLTLEDEAGLANVIIRPDVFDRHRPLILRAPFLVVEGVLQQQEGVTSVRAERRHGALRAISRACHHTTSGNWKFEIGKPQSNFARPDSSGGESHVELHGPRTSLADRCGQPCPRLGARREHGQRSTRTAGAVHLPAEHVLATHRVDDGVGFVAHQRCMQPCLIAVLRVSTAP